MHDAGTQTPGKDSATIRAGSAPCSQLTVRPLLGQETGLAKVVGGRDGSCLTARDAAAGEEHRVVEVGVHQLQVVKDGYYRAALLAPTSQQAHEIERGSAIQRRKGLVEQQQLRVLHERPCE